MSLARSWKKVGRLAGFASLVVIAVPRLAAAAAFAWVPVHEGDIEVVSESRVEAAVRLELIRKAARTIDIITYDQRTDPAIGMPLLVALREAADRGVKVRFMTAWLTEWAKDAHSLVPRFLTEPAAREPIDVRIVGGFQGHHRGWGLFDGIHDKLMVVDGRAALTTGRGQTDYYIDWLDTAFLIKGGLVAESVTAFQDLWTDCESERYLYSRGGRFLTSPVPLPLLREPTLDGPQSAERDRLVGWMAAALADRPPIGEAADESAPIGRARLLHHDFIHQMKALPYRPRSYSTTARIRILKDPIIDAFSERLASASKAKYTSLSLILHPRLRNALEGAAARHAEVKILVNDRSVYHVVSPVAAPWYISLPDVETLLSRGVEVSGFRWVPTEPHSYLHRKVAIVDDAVIFGSHNFNLPSSVGNDEISFEAEVPSLARALERLFDQAWTRNGFAYTVGGIDHARRRTGFQRWLFRPLLPIF